MILSDTHRIYRTIHNKIEKLWNFDPSKRQSNNLNILTGFICGIIQSKEAKLADVVGHIPSAGKEESKIMQLRRWLKNETVNVDLFYLPFIENIIRSLSNQTLILAIDGSTVARGCISLVVSIIYKGRSLPLLWVTRKGKKGHFPEQMHMELIQAVHELIPEGTNVTVLGDGEFDGARWLSLLEDYHWAYSCRTAKNSKCYEKGEEFAIQDICPARGGLTEIEDVEFTEQKVLKVRAIAYWGSRYEEPIYLVSNLPTGKEAVHWYGKRFRIETLFSDFKGRGFRLNKSGLRDPERINRLLIAISLAYIWMVFLGEYALEKGWDKIIHRTDRCDLSLFTLGKRLLNYVLKNGFPIPSFCLTLSGSALE